MKGWKSFFDQMVFHPAGGLVYHARALRYANKYWLNHLQHVQKMLEHWNPPVGSLMLVGPSAGYSLPLNWVKRFQKVIALEPDPVARQLFEIRFGIKPQWIPSMFDIKTHQTSAQAILFCNVLGQVEISDEKQFALQLHQFCEGKSWASYHDVLSGEGFRWLLPHLANKKLDLEALKSGVKTEGKTRTLELGEHSAFELFPASEKNSFDYWEWQITPSQTQVIEGVYYSKG